MRTVALLSAGLIAATAAGTYAVNAVGNPPAPKRAHIVEQEGNLSGKEEPVSKLVAVINGIRVRMRQDIPVRGFIAGDAGANARYLPPRRTGVNIPAVDPSEPVWKMTTGTSGNQSFTTISGSQIDVQVAASHTHICVTARDALACYDKAGDLVGLGQGLAPQVISANAFFTASGITVQAPFDGGNDPIKDGRILFDTHTNRFYMFFQERGTTPRLLIAVSRSEDPADGWYTWADVTTQLNTPNGTLNGHDYDFIGDNAHWLLVSSDMLPCGPNVNGAWQCDNSKRIMVNFMYNARQLARGDLSQRVTWYLNDGANHTTVPVADNFTGPNNDANSYWVERDGSNVIFYKVTPQLKFSTALAQLPNDSNEVDGPTASNEPSGQILEYALIGNSYRNAVKLGDFIAAVSDDSTTWSGQSSPNFAPRLDEFNIKNAVWEADFDPGNATVAVSKDRIFGRNSTGDPANEVFDYGDPGIAINGHGDIGVGELRSNPSTFPEFRASLWQDGRPDIFPSKLLFSSAGVLCSIHMSGAAMDPATGGLYFAQLVGEFPDTSCANSPYIARIGVAKIDGPTKPDLIPAGLVRKSAKFAPPAVALTVLNQGDGPSPPTTGRLYTGPSGDQIIRPSKDTQRTQFKIPALRPGQSVTIVIKFKAPAGTYLVGADILPAGTENSTRNNLNPYLAGLHGNIIMKIG
ncbi:MAG TPA: hypothetical protein VFI65_02665 [Streptosporangiaceae bacterium]|nr:hypothetical protein [Streptosporangiaceae bacterium]